MKKFLGLVFSCVLVLSFVGLASAVDYRREIEKHVLEICYLSAVRNSGLDEQMDEMKAVGMMKQLAAKAWEDAIKGALPVVKKLNNRKDRMKVYKLFLVVCLNALTHDK